MAFCLMEGNEAIARGAVAAGCSFFAGYPITPATSIFSTMLRLLPPRGGICLQGEDEIASIGFCLGASMAGRKVMTATSGPGISLMSEQIGFAVGSEIPIVIVDVQRLGPSTGSATRGADGDVQFLRWCCSGGLPLIVLAPSDVADCWSLTIHAFNLAELFRCPVFIASGKEIAMTRETVDLDLLSLPPIIDRRPPPADAPYLPFAAQPGRLVPDFLPLGGERLVRQTSSTHGEDGYITNDPERIAAMLLRLDGKLGQAEDVVTLYEEESAPAADTLIITYGTASRAARAAALEMARCGCPVSLLILKTLWPVPAQLIRRHAARHRRVLVAEMNLGLYLREIERLLPDMPVVFAGSMDGELLVPDRIAEAVRRG